MSSLCPAYVQLMSSLCPAYVQLMSSLYPAYVRFGHQLHITNTLTAEENKKNRQ